MINYGNTNVNIENNTTNQQPEIPESIICILCFYWTPCAALVIDFFSKLRTWLMIIVKQTLRCSTTQFIDLSIICKRDWSVFFLHWTERCVAQISLWTKFMPSLYKECDSKAILQGRTETVSKLMEEYVWNISKIYISITFSPQWNLEMFLSKPD